MMIGVAQVIGIKPILRSFFSMGPALSCASALAAASGNTCSMRATAPAAPTRRRNSRRRTPIPNTERTTALSTARSIVDCVPGESFFTSDEPITSPPLEMKRKKRLSAHRDKGAFASSSGIDDDAGARSDRCAGPLARLVLLVDLLCQQDCLRDIGHRLAKIHAFFLNERKRLGLGEAAVLHQDA